jgi:hypothetical protein
MTKLFNFSPMSHFSVAAAVINAGPKQDSEVIDAVSKQDKDSSEVKYHEFCDLITTYLKPHHYILLEHSESPRHSWIYECPRELAGDAMPTTFTHLTLQDIPKMFLCQSIERLKADLKALNLNMRLHSLFITRSGWDQFKITIYKISL